jgi:hypothetical protein
MSTLTIRNIEPAIKENSGWWRHHTDAPWKRKCVRFYVIALSKQRQQGVLAVEFMPVLKRLAAMIFALMVEPTRPEGQTFPVSQENDVARYQRGV